MRILCMFRHYYRQIEKDFQSISHAIYIYMHQVSIYWIWMNIVSEEQFFQVRKYNFRFSLVCMQQITKKIKNGMLKVNEEEITYIEKELLLKWMRKWIKNNIAFLPKKYQDMGESLVSENVLDTMKNYGFVDEEENRIKINPICGKIGGGFDVEVKRNVNK